MIEVTNLTKYYADRCAVKGLSFSVKKGQIVGLLGPNGAGKSTTMNMLTGCLAPTEGTISIEGYDILDEPLKARAQIGYLPEIPPLYVDMKVREYLDFVAQLRKIEKAKRKEEVEQAAEQAGVSDVMGRLIRNLSKGYRQRVGLAGALIGHPPFLILDEPTVGLDPKQMIEMRQLIRSLGKQHTVLLSSHILSEVSAVCDHVLIVSNGQLVAQGTPEELQAKMQGGSGMRITVMGSAQTALDTLNAHEQVGDVRIEKEENGQAQLLVEMADDAELKATVSAQLALASCPVIGMAANNMSLEEIFLQLTQQPADQLDEQPEELPESQPEETGETEQEKQEDQDESDL